MGSCLLQLPGDSTMFSMAMWVLTWVWHLREPWRNAQHIHLAFSSKANSQEHLHSLLAIYTMEKWCRLLKIPRTIFQYPFSYRFLLQFRHRVFDLCLMALAACISEVMTERQAVTKTDLQEEMKTHCVSKHRTGLGGRFVSGASNGCEIK